MQRIKTGETTQGVTYITTFPGEGSNISRPAPIDKVTVAKDLILRTPLKLNFAAKAAFGDESSNSLTKITNRTKGITVMTDKEAEKIIAAYKNLAEDILKMIA